MVTLWTIGFHCTGVRISTGLPRTVHRYRVNHMYAKLRPAQTVTLAFARMSVYVCVCGGGERFKQILTRSVGFRAKLYSTNYSFVKQVITISQMTEISIIFYEICLSVLQNIFTEILI